MARLLEWLRDGGTTLSTCTQDQVDVGLSQGPTTCATVRGFLLWTSGRGHSRPLTAPGRLVPDVRHDPVRPKCNIPFLYGALTWFTLGATVIPNFELRTKYRTH